MIHFKDRTFCPYWMDCKKGPECSRALTQKIKDGANKMNLPISVLADKPGCYKEDPEYIHKKFRDDVKRSPEMFES